MTEQSLGRRGFVAAAGASALAGRAAAQTPPPLIPRHLLFAPPERARATISPDGTKIAFLAPLNGVQNVWVAPLDSPTAARALTKIEDRDVSKDICWPQDNRHIV